MTTQVMSIEQTIRDAVPEVSNYGGYLGDAVTALMEREATIADNLRIYGRDAGLPSTQIEMALRQCGLVPQPRTVAEALRVVETQDSDKGKMLEQLDELAQQITELRRQWTED